MSRFHAQVRTIPAERAGDFAHATHCRPPLSRLTDFSRVVRVHHVVRLTSVPIMTTHTRARRIRLGVIGTGLVVKRMHLPTLQSTPEHYEIVAFANDTREPAEEFAAQAGLSMAQYHADYHDLLRRDDVEAVLVTVPIPLLYTVARASLEAGKHVLCEKPTGVDLAEGQAFLALADAFPRQKVMVAETCFYRDDLRLARSLLDAGVIGRVHLMTWHFVSQLVPRQGFYSSTPWRQVPRYRGGPHLDAGVHHLAQIRLLCGDVERLQGFIQYANPTMGGPSDLVLNLHFVSTAIGSYVAGYLPIPTPRDSTDLRLYGSEGVLSVDHRHLRVTRPNGSVDEYVLQSDWGCHNEQKNFYEAVVHDAPIVGTIAQSYHTMLLIMRALDSAEQNQLIEITDAPNGLSEAGVPLWRPHGATGLFDGLPCTIERTESKEQ